MSVVHCISLSVNSDIVRIFIVKQVPDDATFRTSL